MKVILPRLEYIASVTVLHKHQLDNIFRPVKKLFKHKFNLQLSTPDCVLFSSLTKTINSFTDIHYKSHASNLRALFNNPFTEIIAKQKLIYTIQYELYLPSLPNNPLSKYFDSPHRLSQLSTLLYYLNDFNIFLSSRYTSSIMGSNFPLRHLLSHLKPNKFQSLKKKRLLFQNQIVSIDGSYLLTWKEIKHR